MVGSQPALLSIVIVAAKDDRDDDNDKQDLVVDAHALLRFAFLDWADHGHCNHLREDDRPSIGRPRTNVKRRGRGC